MSCYFFFFFALQLLLRRLSVIHFADGYHAMRLSEQLVNGRICLSCCALNSELLLKMHFHQHPVSSSSPGAVSVSAHSSHTTASEPESEREGRGRFVATLMVCWLGSYVTEVFFFFSCYGAIYCFPALMLCLAELESMVKCLIIFSEALHRRPQCLPLSHGERRGTTAFYTRNVYHSVWHYFDIVHDITNETSVPFCGFFLI